ncbi:MAG: hypothetical protein CMM48_15435 [Rhodospirillaceae bacterium]|nr:hypothetical protein [Rhodospirillaceae bacterium]
MQVMGALGFSQDSLVEYCLRRCRGWMIADGPFIEYWQNGQLWSKGKYKNGKKEGPWVSYERDGKVWKKGTYKNGVKVK